MQVVVIVALIVIMLLIILCKCKNDYEWSDTKLAVGGFSLILLGLIIIKYSDSGMFNWSNDTDAFPPAYSESISSF